MIRETLGESNSINCFKLLYFDMLMFKGLQCIVKKVSNLIAHTKYYKYIVNEILD